MCRLKRKRRKMAEAEVQVSLYTYGSHRSRKEGSQRPGTQGTKYGLHAYYLELLSGSIASMAILIAVATFERPILLISNVPFGPLPWTCDNYGLVLFSLVAECNMYNKSSLLLS